MLLDKKRMKKVGVIALTVFLVIAVLFIILFVYLKKNIEFEVDLDIYRNVKSDNITKFYYFQNGVEDIESAVELEGSAIYNVEKQMYAKYDEIPADLRNAFVAIEDKRFYKHSGVDWYRTAGAVLNYIFKFRNTFGASTITQQLVKNVTGNDEYEIERKIQEIFSALDLEEKMEKDEILEIYLNVINLSQGCIGVKAGAKTYFSKELSELTLTECVCLAAITNSPTYYDPYLNPENNKARRQLIFDQMLSLGYISIDQYNECYDADVELNMSKDLVAQKINSWYIDMVIEDVCNDLCEQYEYTRAQASSLVYGGGLNIYTLQEPEIQKILESYYSNEQNFPDSNAEIKTQSAMIIIDPYNGAILGVVGARGEKSGNRIQNYATDTTRPAGSIIKPLSIYAPALEDGIITYATVYDDVPVSFGEYNLDSSKGSIVLPSPWPNNAPTIYHGLVNVNYAIEVSLNTVPVRILDQLGRERSFYFLRDTLECDSLIEEMTLSNGAVITDMDVASLALGQMNYGITLREISAAYSIFVNEGKYSAYRSYALVTDKNGNVLLEQAPRESKAISRDNSIIMTQMLQNVVDYGTAENISLDKTITVAGKTGTSQDYYDRWFVGYTAYCIGGVWCGYEYPKPLDNNTKHLCTEIWDDVMNEVHPILMERQERELASSGNVIKAQYCMDSGKIATAACVADPRGNRIEEGYFVRGTEPKEKCDCHIFVKYDSVCQCIADPSCPKENITYVGLIQVERHFPIQVYVSDAQYVWKKLPDTVLPSMSDNEPFFINMITKGDYCGISYTDKQYNRSCSAHFNYVAWILRRKLHN